MKGSGFAQYVPALLVILVALAGMLYFLFRGSGSTDTTTEEQSSLDAALGKHKE